MIVNFALGKNVFCKEWNYFDNKFQVMTQCKCVGILSKSFGTLSWDTDSTVCFWQIDFVMNYSSASENEMQSAWWSCLSVMLFTITLTYKSVYKTYLIASNSHEKGKDTVVVFLDFLYNYLHDPGAVHDII